MAAAVRPDHSSTIVLRSSQLHSVVFVAGKRWGTDSSAGQPRLACFVSTLVLLLTLKPGCVPNPHFHAVAATALASLRISASVEESRDAGGCQARPLRGDSTGTTPLCDPVCATLPRLREQSLRLARAHLSSVGPALTESSREYELCVTM